jgi:hypothetical protein
LSGWSWEASSAGSVGSASADVEAVWAHADAIVRRTRSTARRIDVVKRTRTCGFRRSLIYR